MEWQAVYVKPRTEKKVFERLQKRFEVFCPIKTEKRQWSDRVKLVDVPLLPGYVFFKGEEAERVAILQDVQVTRSVFWNDKPAIIREEEIEALKEILVKYSEFEMRPMNVGERAKVIAGPLSNATGSVAEIKGSKIKLKLDQLGVILEARLGNVKRIAGK
jgi:transcription antitermination factor NusG